MFKHILEGWIRQYRNVETDGTGNPGGGAPEQTEETQQTTEQT